MPYNILYWNLYKICEAKLMLLSDTKAKTPEMNQQHKKQQNMRKQENYKENFYLLENV